MDYSTESAAEVICRYAAAINDFGKGAKPNLPTHDAFLRFNEAAID